MDNKDATSKAAAITIKGTPQKKVRISAQGRNTSTYTFKGKTFTGAGEVVNVADLGWTEGDLAEARKDPALVIEAVEEPTEKTETPIKKK